MIQHPLPLGALVRYEEKHPSKVSGTGWVAGHGDVTAGESAGYFVVAFPWIKVADKYPKCNDEDTVYMFPEEILEVIEVPA